MTTFYAARTPEQPDSPRLIPRDLDLPRLIDSPLEANLNNCYLRLVGFGAGNVFLKLEGLNPAGSVKLGPAIAMMERLESEGRARPGHNRIVESSSGNLGIALAIVCKVKGYAFTCVTDPNANPSTIKLMQAYGATVTVVGDRDADGGFLGTRIAWIRHLLQTDPRAVWTNQYANPANPGAHYATTAPSIHQAFPALDYLFVGAGTTGTLMGCCRYFAQHRPETKVIGVDTVGSVTFGGPAGPRYLPGVGTSRRPEIADMHIPTEVILIPEEDAVRTCRRLLDTHGLLTGGSTGTVLAAVQNYRVPLGSSVVAISADFGDRYLDTLYDPVWVAARFPSLPETANHPPAGPGHPFGITTDPLTPRRLRHSPAIGFRSRRRAHQH